MNISQILEEFPRFKVLVVGDVSLDLSCYYDPLLSEPSRETGIPNTPCIERDLSPGAAGNMAKNLSLLGARTYLISVCGDDGFGMDLKRVLWDEYKLPKSCVVEDKDKMTFTYTKLLNIKTRKEDKGRVDFLELVPISKEAEDAILDKLKRLVPVVDAVIIGDQKETENPGVITENIRKLLHHQREKYPDKPFIVDSRKRAHLFRDMILKPNDQEFVSLYNALFSKNEKPRETMSFAKRYGFDVSERIGAPLYITFSERGILYVDAKECIQKRIFTPTVEPVDVTGAGDAFLAGLTLSLLATKDPVFSAKVANNVAAISVTREGTGKVTPLDVKENWQELGHVDVIHPDIDILDAHIEKGKVKHIVFDFDGTISTLREGWENIMGPLMVEMITGGKKNSRVEERVKEFIEKTTGIQTILQMEGLVDMIKEFGYIPPSEIRDALYYKTLYRNRIIELVKKRMNRVTDGEVPLDFYLIRGAREFLEKLYKKGYILYLASGTDKKDVINEAKFLKVDQYFKGGIYGSLDNIEEYSKHKVMQDIIETNNLQGPELLVFGDGPVEIRDSRAHGGIGVGVASYEKEGEGGWNPDKIKRLVNAGAQILIPDFSVADPIIDYLSL